MRRLILFRHAKTEPRPNGGVDFDRRLTERGRADAVRMGAILAEAGEVPDLALVSPAVRARETWDLARPAFPGARSEFRRGLYDATAEEVAAELDAEARAAASVMIVGHNPGLHEWALDLLADATDAAEEVEALTAGLPTAAVAVFAYDGAGPATLARLFHARAYQGPES